MEGADQRSRQLSGTGVLLYFLGFLPFSPLSIFGETLAILFHTFVPGSVSLGFFYSSSITTSFFTTSDIAMACRIMPSLYTHAMYITPGIYSISLSIFGPAAGTQIISPNGRLRVIG